MSDFSKRLYEGWKSKIRTYADLAKEVGDMVLCNNMSPTELAWGWN